MPKVVLGGFWLAKSGQTLTVDLGSTFGVNYRCGTAAPQGASQI